MPSRENIHRPLEAAERSPSHPAPPFRDRREMWFRIFRWVAAFGIATMVLVGYLTINVWNQTRFAEGIIQPISLWTSFDHMIPVVPQAFWTYNLYYFMALIPVFLLRTNRDIVETALGYVLMNGIAMVCWVLLPVRMKYPELDCAGLSCQMLQGLHEVDGGANIFPSMHTALSVYAAIRFGELRHRLTPVVVVAALLVIASTILTKQHYVLDLPPGALLAVASWYTAKTVVGRGRHAHRP